MRTEQTIPADNSPTNQCLPDDPPGERSPDDIPDNDDCDHGANDRFSSSSDVGSIHGSFPGNAPNHTTSDITAQNSTSTMTAPKVFF